MFKAKPLTSAESRKANADFCESNTKHVKSEVSKLGIETPEEDSGLNAAGLGENSRGGQWSVVLTPQDWCLPRTHLG